MLCRSPSPWTSKRVTVWGELSMRLSLCPAVSQVLQKWWGGFFQFFPSCNLTQEGFNSSVTSETGLLNSGRCKYIKIHLTIMLYFCSLCIYFFRSKSRIKYLNGNCIGKCLEWEVWKLRSNFYCKVFKLKVKYTGPPKCELPMSCYPDSPGNER